MQSLNIASTGMLAQQTNVEVISNNIANMNTTAFKRHRAQFQDLLYQDLRRYPAWCWCAHRRHLPGQRAGLADPHG